jgi:hypothetical protein
MPSAIVLNNIETSLTSAEGRDFVADCVRAGEGLISDAELQDKYEIAADAWKGIIKNAALIRAIRAESERRVRTGVAAQEAASKHFAKAPGYLNDILSDKAASPRYRIEASKELRATAIGDGANKNGAPTDKFIININLGSHREHYEVPIAATPKELTKDEVNWGWRDRDNE